MIYAYYIWIHRLNKSIATMAIQLDRRQFYSNDHSSLEIEPADLVEYGGQNNSWLLTAARMEKERQRCPHPDLFPGGRGENRSPVHSRQSEGTCENWKIEMLMTNSWQCVPNPVLISSSATPMRPRDTNCQWKASLE
jgi:hypothetical protein